jgi:ABC-type lipoprotein release transport system permease subunit
MLWRLRLSYFYWKHHPWWLLGTVLSIAVTVSLTFVVAHLLVTTRATYDRLVLKPLGSADSQLAATEDEGMFATWQTVLETMPGLDVITPVLSRQTLVIYKDTKVSVQVRGIDSETEFLIHPVRLLTGRNITNTDEASVMVSSALSTQLGVTIGETLELVTPHGFRSYTVVGISDDSSSLVIAPLHEIQTLFTSGERVDGFDIRFTPTTHKNIAIQTLQKRFKSVATVMTLGERVQPVRNVLIVVRIMLLTVLGFSVVMLVCLLLSFLGATKLGRSNETQTLYALGVSQAQLTRWLTLELSVIFIIASFLGVLVTAVFMQRDSTQFSYVPFLSASVMTALVVLGTVLFLPIHPPVTTIRQDHAWLQTLPVNVWLSWQLFSQLGRSYWLAVTLLTVALTGFTSMGILLQVQHESLESLMTASTNPSVLTERNLQIQEESPLEGTLSTTMRWNMAMMPGVVFVSSHLAKVMMEEKFEEDMYVLDLESFPYQSYFQTTQGVASDVLPEVLGAERNLAISASLAESYGLRAGMGLTLRTPTGSHRYKIVAVLQDIGGVSRAMFIDRQVYLKDWRRSSDHLFLLSFEETLRPQQVAALLQEQLNQHYKGLPWRAASFKSELEQLVGEIVAWCRWLMLSFALVAAVALSHAVLGSSLRALLLAFYLLGGQRHLLSRITQDTLLFITVLITSTALTVGTSLSYLVVHALNRSGSYWLWQVSSPSYIPSLAVIGLLAVFLVILTKHVVPSAKK